MSQTDVRVVNRSALMEICRLAGWYPPDVLSVTFTADTIQAKLFARDEDGKRVPIPDRPGKFYCVYAMALVGDN